MGFLGAALVVRATYLVCHRLISSWKGDLQVSLAALELLSGLAKLHSAKPGNYLGTLSSITTFCNDVAMYSFSFQSYDYEKNKK